MVDEHVDTQETDETEVEETEVEEVVDEKPASGKPAKGGASKDAAFERIKRERDKLKVQLDDTQKKLNEALAQAKTTEEISAAKAEADAEIYKLRQLSANGLDLDWADSIPATDQDAIDKHIERIKSRIPVVTTTARPSSEDPEEEQEEEEAPEPKRRAVSRPAPKGTTTIKVDVRKMTPDQRKAHFEDKL